ncbi:MAG: glycosyltransferase family 2 protein [bacterium]|nr:glycosyltransferase family 2 protein [bacterium]
MIKYSIIIPVYNEIDVIQNCLESLKKQTVASDMEIIVVDDGSTDGSEKFATYKQKHQGPGAARNLGASHSKGKALVFVDADMEFAPDFIEKLCKPIKDDVIGTFSKDEYLLNKDKPIARYWNMNLGRNPEKMHPENYPDEQNVFRAILKSEFEKVGGFDENVGYTDDWSLSRKLNMMAVAAPNAVFYHNNPETYQEVWKQARWFGKNEFLTRNLVRKVYNLVRYCPLLAITKISDFGFFKFKLVFNTAVFTSVILSFFNEPKSK